MIVAPNVMDEEEEGSSQELLDLLKAAENCTIVMLNPSIAPCEAHSYLLSAIDSYEPVYMLRTLTVIYFILFHFSLFFIFICPFFYTIFFHHPFVSIIMIQ